MNGVIPPLPVCFHGVKIDSFLFILSVISINYDKYWLTAALQLQTGPLLDECAPLPLGINHGIRCRNHSDHKTSRLSAVFPKVYFLTKTSHTHTHTHTSALESIYTLL